MAVDSYMNLQVYYFIQSSFYLVLYWHTYMYIQLMVKVINIINVYLQLANTEEFVDGELAGNLGEVLIRCNNVLYVREAEINI